MYHISDIPMIAANQDTYIKPLINLEPNMQNAPNRIVSKIESSKVPTVPPKKVPKFVQDAELAISPTVVSEIENAYAKDATPDPTKATKSTINTYSMLQAKPIEEWKILPTQT